MHLNQQTVERQKDASNKKKRKILQNKRLQISQPLSKTSLSQHLLSLILLLPSRPLFWGNLPHSFRPCLLLPSLCYPQLIICRCKTASWWAPTNRSHQLKDSRVPKHTNINTQALEHSNSIYMEGKQHQSDTWVEDHPLCNHWSQAYRPHLLYNMGCILVCHSGIKIWHKHWCKTK